MSQQRRRAREAREAVAAARPVTKAPVRFRRSARPAGRPRRRRYGALPTRTRLQLLATFVAVQLLFGQLVHGLGARASFAVLTAAVLLVLVTTRDPASKRSTPR